jgi:hypothetical protein
MNWHLCERRVARISYSGKPRGRSALMAPNALLVWRDGRDAPPHPQGRVVAFLGYPS